MERPKARVSDDILRVKRAEEMNAGKMHKRADVVSAPKAGEEKKEDWTKVRK